MLGTTGARAVVLSTQYARNGPLIPESREFVRMVAAGLSRPERRQRLVVENGLARPTFKSRRNLFEALEGRFSLEQRARDLGQLSFSNASPRALMIGFLSELAETDELVKRYLHFVHAKIGEEHCYADARLFIAELAETSTVVQAWAPSLQRRAVSSLNSLPFHYGLWENTRLKLIPRPQLPLEVCGLIFSWQLDQEQSVLRAPFFETLAMRRDDILELLWACARRGWFEVEAQGDVLRVQHEARCVEGARINAVVR